MSPTPEPPTATAAADGNDPESRVLRRRGCLGSLISGGCGCTAFLVGAALAIAVAAPQLLAGWGARAIEGYVESRIDGNVEVYDLELHWNQPQRARQVTVDTPDGDRILEFALRFPSLFDLLDDPRPEWFFRISEAKVTARVAADGTSDLGQVFGQGDSPERTELELLGGLFARNFREQSPGSAPRSPSRQSTVRASIQIEEARFIDMSSGVGPERREAVVTDAVLLATRSRVGLQAEVKGARVISDGMSAPADASISLNFGPEDQAQPWRLRSAELSLDPIPLDVLRLLGVVRREVVRREVVRREVERREVELSDAAQRDSERTPRPGAARAPLRRRRLVQAEGAYGVLAGLLEQALGEFMKDGASVEARYGPLGPRSDAGDRGEGSGEGTAEVLVEASGSAGELLLRAQHVNGELIARAELGEESAFSAGFRMTPGALTRTLGALVPEGSVELRDERVDARWFVRSREFRVPLSARSLTPSAFFGSAPLVPAASNEAGAGSSGRALRAFAAALRRADGTFSFTSRGSSAARLAILPANPERQSAYDRLDWTHSLTELRFSGALGAQLRSLWRVDQASRELAEISLAIPAVGLTPAEDLAPRLDVRLPALSIALLESLVPVPDDLSVLLPRRFSHLALRGIRVPTRGTGTAGPQRITPPVEVSVLLGDTDRISGVFQDGQLAIPKASVSTDLDSVSCERIIRAYMPWLKEVKPGADPGAGGADQNLLRIDMNNLTLSFEEGDLRQDGEVTLRSSPLLVRLHPEIARELGSGEEDSDDGWIAWTPAATELSLEPSMVRYDRIELPLSDDYVTVLEGSFDRKKRSYILQGLVDSSYIVKGSENDEAVRLVLISSSQTDFGEAVIIGFQRGSIDPELKQLMQMATELGDK